MFRQVCLMKSRRELSRRPGRQRSSKQVVVKKYSGMFIQQHHDRWRGPRPCRSPCASTLHGCDPRVGEHKTFRPPRSAGLHRKTGGHWRFGAYQTKSFGEISKMQGLALKCGRTDLLYDAVAAGPSGLVSGLVLLFVGLCVSRLSCLVCPSVSRSRVCGFLELQDECRNNFV